jgi:predicted Zn finger-like uncharacterized protein
VPGATRREEALMKIVCDNCAAKYSINDEKVAGRVFKIRCKKCGEPIVVRGDQVDHAHEEETARAVEYSADAIWQVLIDGEPQGPFPPAELGEMLTDGRMTWETYVWREGLDDWLPAQEAEELRAALQPKGDEEDAAAVAAAPAADDDPFAAGDASTGDDTEDSADLFAQADAASAFGPGSDDDGLVASPMGGSTSTSTSAAEQELTGARNENSVLFSLSNLQALTTAADDGGGDVTTSPMSSRAPGSGRSGMAAGEGSGLIDIRALAAATGVDGSGGLGPVTSSSDDRVDDLLAIGGGGLGASALGAPVIVPPAEPEEKASGGGGTKPVIIGILGLLLVVLIGLGGAYALFGGREETTPAGGIGTVQPQGSVPTPGTAGEDQSEGQGEEAEASPDEDEDEDQGSAEDEAAEEEEEEPEEDTASESPRRRTTRRARRPSTSDETPSGTTTRTPSRPRGGDDIDSLLEGALSGSDDRQRRPAPQPASSGRETPTRSDVSSAMESVAPAVRACGNGAGGRVMVRVVFQGTSGRATNAQANAPNLPPPVRSCIARAVRGASVRPFDRSTFSVVYPFNL